MILNLETTKVQRLSKTEFEILFALPKIYFNQDQFVHVNEIGIKWTRNVPVSKACLCCTLIDKNPFNINQQLLFIPMYGSSYTFHTPTHVQPYKIQRPELESSQFILNVPEKVEIKEIYIQLQFTNARLQQVHQKPFQA